MQLLDGSMGRLPAGSYQLQSIVVGPPSHLVHLVVGPPITIQITDE